MISDSQAAQIETNDSSKSMGQKTVMCCHKKAE